MADDRKPRPPPLQEVPEQDIPEQDIDDIIGIASRLQDEARQTQQTASRADLAAIARELDIGPEHVDGAIEDLEAQRKAAAELAVQEAHRAALRKKLALQGLVGLVLVSILLAFGSLSAAWLASGRVEDAASEAHAAEARLMAVLERQASLAPQLLALAGGQSGEISALAVSVRSADTLHERMEAAALLGEEMAAAIRALPPPKDSAETTQRLQLSDEIAGSQNRVSTELRRYREAEAAWRDTCDGGLGGLAVTLGMAEAPDPARPID